METIRQVGTGLLAVFCTIGTASVAESATHAQTGLGFGLLLSASVWMAANSVSMWRAALVRQ